MLGRVIYGSFEMLEQVLKMTSASVSLFLNDKDGGAWAAEWPAFLVEIVGAERILPIRSKRLFAGYMEDVVNAAAARCGDFCIMIYGSPTSALLQHCSEAFNNVVVHGELPPQAPENSWQIADFSDRMHFDLGIGVALLLCPPSPSDSASIDQLLLPEGSVITAGHFPRFEMDIQAARFCVLMRTIPIAARWTDGWPSRILLKSAQPSPMAMQ